MQKCYGSEIVYTLSVRTHVTAFHEQVLWRQLSTNMRDGPWSMTFAYTDKMHIHFHLEHVIFMHTLFHSLLFWTHIIAPTDASLISILFDISS